MSDELGTKVTLEGVGPYRIMDPWFEGVRVILSYRGETFSPAYVQGISGSAFKISGPCPCAPTNGQRFEPQDLARLFGYETELLPLYGEGIETEQVIDEVIERIKGEIRAGRPVLLWHAFTVAEWDVVAGFGEYDFLFYGRGSYAGGMEFAAEDMKRTLTSFDVCPPLGALLIQEKTRTFEAARAEREALQWAIQHARTPDDRVCCPSDEALPDWRFRNGLGCYDWWVANYRKNPKRIPNFGERYCLGVYASTHRAGANFCRAMAAKYPEAAVHFQYAAESMDVEANQLQSCLELLFPDWKIPEAQDTVRSEKAAFLLSQAQAAYGRAIDEIECALGYM